MSLIVDVFVKCYEAITTAHFTIVAAHPVKAEMSVSKTKSATTHPINLDAIIVCKKQVQHQFSENAESLIWSSARERYQRYCARLGNAGRMLSQNDRYVILSSQILVSASLAGVNMITMQHLLERAYIFDFSHEEKLAQVKNPELSQDFWKNQLVTEQTSFVFLQK